MTIPRSRGWVPGDPGSYEFYKGGGDGLQTTPSQTVKVPSGIGTIVIGDLTGNRRVEIVAGHAGATVGNIARAGRVLLWEGNAAGIDTSKPVQILTENTSGVPGRTETDDLFGRAIAIGDANGDGIRDLAIGVPGQAISSAPSAGYVHVIPGKVGGLNFAAAKTFAQNSPGIPDTVEADDFFGYNLLFRDLNGDGRQDLVVTVARDELVHVLNGSANGITGSGSKVLTPANFEIAPRSSFGNGLG